MLSKIETRRKQATRIRAAARPTSRTDAPAPFLKYLEGAGLETPAHVRRIAASVERVANRDELRLVIAMPPRHGKTETLLRAFAWLLSREPSSTMAYATYGADLARSKSRSARRYARDAGVQLAHDSASVTEWRTQAGGGLLATGAGGPLTGQGINRLLVIDDPIKNRQEAESALIRDRTWDWFTDVAFTRLEPGASAIVVATRWHPDDLSGRLIADGWDSIVLPAINEREEALWPTRYPLERLRDIERQVGVYTWASLYQGSPRPRGGAVFQDAWYYDELPPDPFREAIGVDFAYTAKSHADYSVAVRGRAIGDTLYLTHVYRAQVEMPAFAAHLKAQAGTRMLARIGGTEKGIVDFLRRDGIRVDTIPASTDKHAFAQPLAAAWNTGRVLLPRHAPWVPTLLDEVLSFTGVNDAHDDIVDALGALHHALYIKTKADLASVRRASGL
jgi:predicted phage terminase large subunit-like protein